MTTRTKSNAATKNALTGEQGRESAMLAKVNPSTLSVTHICDGEEVITGGDDGQVWIGTFADRSMAAHFVNYAKAHLFHVNGERRPEKETSALCPHGMPRAENVCGPCSEGEPNRQWLIRKRGYYYRPNRAGYTASVAEAGRYTEAEAKAEAAIEPAIMQAIPLWQALREVSAPNPVI
jgi:hypothetical protein